MEKQLKSNYLLLLWDRIIKLGMIKDRIPFNHLDEESALWNLTIQIDEKTDLLWKVYNFISLYNEIDSKSYLHNPNTSLVL